MRKGERIETYRSLAARCRDARGADRRLDGDVFRRLNADDGREWSRDVGDDQVWHVVDAEDPGAWTGPPSYTGSFDAADAARAPGTRLSSLRELEPTDGAGPDWRPCASTLGIPGRTVTDHGHTLATAHLAAIMTTHAIAAGED